MRDAAEVLARLHGLALWQGLLVLACLLAAQAFRAERVHAEWSRRAQVGWWECLRVVSLHYSLLNLLPMRTGEAGYAWLLWRRWRVPLSESASSLLVWRLQDGLILVGYVLLLALPLALPARLALVTAYAGMLWLATRHRDRLARGLGGLANRSRQPGRPRRLQRLCASIAQAVAHGGAKRSAWICGMATWSLKLATAAALLIWLTQPQGLAPEVALVAALAGEWGAALPLQPAAGFGTYEAATLAGALAASEIAISTPKVLAAALAAHLVSASFSILLGSLFWLGTHLAPLSTGRQP